MNNSTNTTQHKKDSQVPMAERYPINITSDLFEFFKTAKRYGDGGRIETKLRSQFSRPVIDRVIKYGHCNSPDLLTKVTKFFKDRLEKEKATGAGLLTKANES